MRVTRWQAALAGLLLLIILFPGSLQAQETSPPRLFLPLITTSTRCPAGTGESYAAIIVEPPPSDRPAAEHADLNLALRSYAPTGGVLGLVDYGGATDPLAPQLYGCSATSARGRSPRCTGSTTGTGPATAAAARWPTRR